MGSSTGERLRFRRRTFHVPNQMHQFNVFFSITALVNDISCVKKRTHRSMTTVLSKWNFKLQHVKRGQLKTVYFQLSPTLFICFEIHVVYLHFNMIAISLNIKRKQHRKLFRPDPTLYVTYTFFQVKWKGNKSFQNNFIDSFSYFKRWKWSFFTPRIGFGTWKRSTYESNSRT